MEPLHPDGGTAHRIVTTIPKVAYIISAHKKYCPWSQENNNNKRSPSGLWRRLSFHEKGCLNQNR